VTGGFPGFAHPLVHQEDTVGALCPDTARLHITDTARLLKDTPKSSPAPPGTALQASGLGTAPTVSHHKQARVFRKGTHSPGLGQALKDD
jgi:hypothetical protein